MQEDILQLKISITETNPLIWRRVLVDGSVTFLELHCIIQLAMGWNNSHLFEFMDEETIIALPYDDLADRREAHIDASVMCLDNLFIIEEQKMKYIYDFGDYWEHEIILEKALPKEKGKKYPICIAGEMNCPREDSGGIQGFYEMLKVLEDKNHDEHKEVAKWLGKNYNPSSFDIEKINKQLKKVKTVLADYF